MSQKFVQIIDFETQRIDEVRALLLDFEQQMMAQSPRPDSAPTHRMMLADRDTEGRHLAIVEFESYEDAMRNNERPEINKLSERLVALCTRPPAFTNCDLTDSRELK
ncbi:hypothetical protein [Streptomyces sp. NPDC050145]|uniref:hypothetical protein n=1 Tax=Streptomyces sp. NPDC050145 TaxID=3365602 RepID=UPI00379D5768